MDTLRLTAEKDTHTLAVVALEVAAAEKFPTHITETGLLESGQFKAMVPCRSIHHTHRSSHTVNVGHGRGSHCKGTVAMPHRPWIYHCCLAHSAQRKRLGAQ